MRCIVATLHRCSRTLRVACYMLRVTCRVACCVLRVYIADRHRAVALRCTAALLGHGTGLIIGRTVSGNNVWLRVATGACRCTALPSRSFLGCLLQQRSILNRNRIMRNAMRCDAMRCDAMACDAVACALSCGQPQLTALGAQTAGNRMTMAQSALIEKQPVATFRTVVHHVVLDCNTLFWVAASYTLLQHGAHSAALQEMAACALVGKPLADALLFEAEASNWSALSVSPLSRQLSRRPCPP